MAKPIIAVDIDDTLAASAAAYVAYSNERWGTNLAPDDFTEDWATMWRVDHQTMLARSAELNRDRIIKDFLHYEDAVGVLQELAKRYELVITSSRTQLVHAETLAWLDEYFRGVFSNVHLTGFYDSTDAGGHLLTKADLIRDIGADYLIDDQPKHCLAVAADGGKAILFGDYSWNRNIGSSEGVVRCKDWNAVLEYFNGES